MLMQALAGSIKKITLPVAVDLQSHYEPAYETDQECAQKELDTNPAVSQVSFANFLQYERQLELLQLSQHSTDNFAAMYQLLKQPLFDFSHGEISTATVDPNVLLLSKDDYQKCGGTPLHNAARDGNLKMVNLLLDCGARASRVAQTNLKGHYNTPLHAAVNGRKPNGDYPSVIKRLLVAGADPNVGGEGHACIPLTPLMCLAMQLNWRPEVVQALFSLNRIDINKQSYRQLKTALHVAAEHDNDEMVRYLLDHDADENVTDAKERNALSVAIDQKSLKVVGTLTNTDENSPIVNAVRLLKNRSSTNNKRKNRCKPIVLLD